MDIEVNQKRHVNWLFLFMSIFLWLVVLAWMWLIFSLSAESGQDSLSRSDSIIELVGKRFSFNISSEAVRKTMHLLEFGMLTALSYVAFASSARIARNKSFIEMSSTDIKAGFEMNASFSLWITVLYAVFDEYHQIFVFGRNGSIIDVLIDIAGGLAVIVIIRIIHALANVIKKIRLSQKEA